MNNLDELIKQIEALPEGWDLFQVPEVELPPEYDGHTPADAAKRLHSALDAWREVKKEGR